MPSHLGLCEDDAITEHSSRLFEALCDSPRNGAYSLPERMFVVLNMRKEVFMSSVVRRPSSVVRRPS